MLKAPCSSQDLRVHQHEPVWRITDSNPNRAFLPSHSSSFCIQKLIYWNDGMVLKTHKSDSSPLKISLTLEMFTSEDVV